MSPYQTKGLGGLVGSCDSARAALGDMVLFSRTVSRVILSLAVLCDIHQENPPEVPSKESKLHPHKILSS